MHRGCNRLPSTPPTNPLQASLGPPHPPLAPGPASPHEHALTAAGAAAPARAAQLSWVASTPGRSGRPSRLLLRGPPVPTAAAGSGPGSGPTRFAAWPVRKDVPVSTVSYLDPCTQFIQVYGSPPNAAGVRNFQAIIPPLLLRPARRRARDPDSAPDPRIPDQAARLRAPTNRPGSGTGPGPSEGPSLGPPVAAVCRPKALGGPGPIPGPDSVEARAFGWPPCAARRRGSGSKTGSSGWH